MGNSDKTNLQAVITSDLHYTIQPNVMGDIIPAMPYAGELTEAMAKEIIERRPDVFIMTGDNTNSGRRSDADALVIVLQRIKDAGITVILTTGNHDKDLGTREDYVRIYDPLLEPENRDSESLSYLKTVGNTVFFAMDDSFAVKGVGGAFPASTMDWLETNLKEQKSLGHTIIFLSHHSVLTEDTSGFYRIGNKDLYKLLKKYGVELCFTGHQHAQIILHKQKMYEIISGMPLMSPHLYGVLQIDGRQVSYHTEHFDFDTYASRRITSRLKRGEYDRAKQLRGTFRKICEREGLPEEKIEGVIDLVQRYFAWYAEGTIADHIREIRRDPYYSAMVTALKNTNYGPWIQSVLSNKTLPADRLEFRY